MSGSMLRDHQGGFGDHQGGLGGLGLNLGCYADQIMPKSSEPLPPL